MKSKSRKLNAFPYLTIPLAERLKQSGNIDLHDNFKIEDAGGGYVRITPINTPAAHSL